MIKITGEVPIGGLTVILPKIPPKIPPIIMRRIPNNLDKMKDVTPKNEPTGTLALDNFAHAVETNLNKKICNDKAKRK